MSLKLKDIVGNLFHTDKKEKEAQAKKSAALQQTTNDVFGTNPKGSANTLNPFLNKNGELFNPLLNYQKILDNPNISQRAKQYISQATGLSPTVTQKRTVAPSTFYASITPENPIAPKISGNQPIGFISAKYESGGNGGSVSSGNGDYGGVSYGISQFSSKVGSADKFVSWLKQTNPEMASAFKNHKAGTNEFSNAWKQTFSTYGDEFTKFQSQYTYANYVEPLAKLAKQKTGIDYTRSPALMELLYSTAIQFGAGNLGLSALGNVTSGMSDTEIVNASYDKKISNYKSFFKSSSKAVQESVKNRFVNERNDVLKLIN